ncbi:MAG: hypothetical protein WBB34_19745 [Xanthobacteraceae bacterium]
MASPEKIPDSLLTRAQIPGENATWQEIGQFALTFDGYAEWGSLERCAEIANGRRNETLAELRTCLFFEQRRWNHFGHSPDAKTMEYIQGLLAAMREKVSTASSA